MKKQLVHNHLKLERMRTANPDKKIVLDDITYDSLDWFVPDLEELMDVDKISDNSSMATGDFSASLRKNPTCVGTCDGCSCNLPQKVADVFNQNPRIQEMVTGSVEGARELLKDVVNDALSKLHESGMVKDCNPNLPERIKALENKLNSFVAPVEKPTNEALRKGITYVDDIVPHCLNNSLFEPFMSNGTDSDSVKKRRHFLDSLIRDAADALLKNAEARASSVFEISKDEARQIAGVSKYNLERYGSADLRKHLRMHTLDNEILNGEEVVREEQETGIKIEVGNNTQRWLVNRHGFSALRGALDNVLYNSGSGYDTTSLKNKLEDDPGLEPFIIEAIAQIGDRECFSGTANSLAAYFTAYFIHKRNGGFTYGSFKKDANRVSMQAEVEQLIREFLKKNNALDIVNVMDIEGIAPSNPAEPEPAAAKSTTTTSKVLLAENEIRKQSIDVLRDVIKCLKEDDIRHTIASNTSNNNKKVSFKEKEDCDIRYFYKKKKISTTPVPLRTPTTLRNILKSSKRVAATTPQFNAQPFLKQVWAKLEASAMTLTVRKLDVEGIRHSLLSDIPQNVLESSASPENLMIISSIAQSLKRQQNGKIGSNLIREGIVVARDQYGVVVSEDCLAYFVRQGTTNALNTINIAKGLTMSTDMSYFKPALDHITKSIPSNTKRREVENNLVMTLDSFKVNQCTHIPTSSIQQKWVDGCRDLQARQFADIGKYISTPDLLNQSEKSLRLYTAVRNEELKGLPPYNPNSNKDACRWLLTETYLPNSIMSAKMTELQQDILRDAANEDVRKRQEQKAKATTSSSLLAVKSPPIKSMVQDDNKEEEEEEEASELSSAEESESESVS